MPIKRKVGSKVKRVAFLFTSVSQCKWEKGLPSGESDANAPERPKLWIEACLAIASIHFQLHHCELRTYKCVWEHLI